MKTNKTSASKGILEGIKVDTPVNDKNSKSTKQELSKSNLSTNNEKSKGVKEYISNDVNTSKSNTGNDETIKDLNKETSKKSNTKKRNSSNTQKSKPIKEKIKKTKKNFMLTSETIKKLEILELAIKDNSNNKDQSAIVSSAIDMYFKKNKKAVDDVLKLIGSIK